MTRAIVPPNRRPKRPAFIEAIRTPSAVSYTAIEQGIRTEATQAPPWRRQRHRGQRPQNAGRPAPQKTVHSASLSHRGAASSAPIKPHQIIEVQGFDVSGQAPVRQPTNR